MFLLQLSNCKLQQESCQFYFHGNSHYIALNAGGYHIFTAGNLEAPHLATKQTIPFYSQHHITVNQPAKHAPLQNDHVSRAVNAHASGHRSNFSGGCFSDASDSENDIDVKLIANDGRTVYAGSCVFLELSYERKLEGGTTVEV